MADPTGAKTPQSIRTLKDASSLAEKRRELESLRHRDKIDWTLNREFYKGNQYAYWNKMWPNGGRLDFTHLVTAGVLAPGGVSEPRRTTFVIRGDRPLDPVTRGLASLLELKTKVLAGGGNTK